MLLSAIAWRELGWRAGAAAPVVPRALALAALAAFEREAAVVRTVQAWLAVTRAPATARRRLARQRAQLANVLDDVYEWLRR